MSKRKRQSNNNKRSTYSMTWGETFGSSESGISGVNVTRKRALGYPAVWRAVSLISGDVAQLPLLVYKQVGKNREVAPEHPANRLVSKKPNACMSAFTYKQTLMHHVLTEGNGYAYVWRDNAGTPLDLLLLDPDDVQPVRIDGQPWYIYNSVNSGLDARRLPGSDVIHIKGLGYDGLRGYPVLDYHKDSLGAAIAARDHSGRFFQNDARPGGVLQHNGPGKLTPEARKNMRDSWERLHKGLSNAHKVAILEEGTEYKAFVSNAKDAQMLESRAFDSREVANIFGVPTHKLGDPSKVAYNSLDAENQSYFDDTLSRHLFVFAEEHEDKLLSEDEKNKNSHLVDFDYQRLQKYLAPQMSFVGVALDKGLMCPDEGRAVFGMNPRPDGQGGKYAGAVASQASEPPKADPIPVVDPPTSQPPTVSDGLRAVIFDTVGRMVRRLITQAERETKKPGQKFDEIVERNLAVVEQSLNPVELLAKEAGLTVNVGELSRYVCETTMMRFVNPCEDSSVTLTDSVATECVAGVVGALTKKVS